MTWQETQGGGLDNQQHGKKQTEPWARQPTTQQETQGSGLDNNMARNRLSHGLDNQQHSKKHRAVG